MRAFIIRTTAYPGEGERTVRDFAVLTDTTQSAMVAVIRDQPVGVMIEVTGRVLSPAEAAALTLVPDRPKPLP